MRTTTHETPEMHPADAGTMRAIVQDRYGTTESWRLTTVPIPRIGAEEVLVRVHAAGLDRGTWHSMTGTPYLMRLMGFGFRGPKNRVPGLATAGTVVAVGSAVTRFAVGDDVHGVSRGAFAEYAVAAADKLAAMPTGLTHAQAAAVPVSATTAMQAIERGGVAAGHHVLVTGASGGVGSYAVQIAKALGAEVTGVCSAAKADLVRDLGADHVLDHTRDDLADAARRFDVVVDVAGNTPLRRLRKILARRGSLVIVGGESKGGWTGGLGRSLRAPLWSLVVGQRLSMLVSNERHPSLETVDGLIEDGRVVPAIDRTFPLDEAGAAMRHLEAGRVRGKIVVAVAAPR